MTIELTCNPFHFYLHRIKLWLIFYITLPKHLIFCKQEFGWCHGFILCEEPCGHCIDMGINYGMHCEGCYNFAHELGFRRVQRLGEDPR